MKTIFSTVLLVLLSSILSFGDEANKLSIINDQQDHSSWHYVQFGEAPSYIEFAKSRSILLDFPSVQPETKSIGVIVNQDTILLDHAQPLQIEMGSAATLKVSIFDRTNPDNKNLLLSGSTSMKIKVIEKKPLITNDAIVFGILFLCLALIFYTSHSENKALKKFYKYVPALLMCYLVPSILVSMGLISADISKTYSIAKNYLLPTALILMTLSIDMKGIVRLGSKSLIMFFTATVGIVIGGPLAILIVSTFSPDTVGGAGTDAVWRGLATLAGSWIGGGANQVAMLEIYQFNPQKYGGMVLVDIVVANIWMAFLLLGVGKREKIDRWLKADSSAITELQKKVENYTLSITKNPNLRDLIIVLGVGFGLTGLSHLISQGITGYISSIPSMAQSVLNSSFFWLVVGATTFGLAISFTKLRSLEGYGASKMGSVFIYILVATIGMKMDLRQIVENPMLIIVGLIWMAIHVGLLVGVAKMIRAPFFFLAVGSKANIGGAASAPVVAAAFHPSLAPVGVLLAVLGYALGTYGAMACAWLMEMASKF